MLGAENMIPELRCHSKSPVLISEVVLQVVLSESVNPFYAGLWSEMAIIVNHIIEGHPCCNAYNGPKSCNIAEEKGIEHLDRQH